MKAKYWKEIQNHISKVSLESALHTALDEALWYESWAYLHICRWAACQMALPQVLEVQRIRRKERKGKEDSGGGCDKSKALPRHPTAVILYHNFGCLQLPGTHFHWLLIKIRNLVRNFYQASKHLVKQVSSLAVHRAIHQMLRRHSRIWKLRRSE